MRGWLLIAGAVVSVSVGALWAKGLMLLVVSEEMTPGLLPADRLWTIDRTPAVGDVVVLSDPLDPARTLLRRVLAGPGSTVSFSGDVATVDGNPLEHLEMFRDASRVVLRERHAYQIQREPGRTRAQVAAQTVPVDHLYLAADNRSLGVDSRWWGPVPISSVDAVVIWRIGPPTAWRGRTGKP